MLHIDRHESEPAAMSMYGIYRPRVQKSMPVTDRDEVIRSLSIGAPKSSWSAKKPSNGFENLLLSIIPCRMISFLVLVLCLLFGFFSPHTLATETTEIWECDLDLHGDGVSGPPRERANGGRGRLELYRLGERQIHGRTVVYGLEHNIEGTWAGNGIQFKRQLARYSYQLFQGFAGSVAGGAVELNGRFGVEALGVWSANCQLVARESGAEEIPSLGPEHVHVNVHGNSISTLGESVRIRATADDNVNVAAITIYIDARSVKTCQALECRYSKVPTERGRYRFWAEAVDTLGNKARSETMEFTVQLREVPGPNIRQWTEPFRPTNQDRIRFIAEAVHRNGVRNITIYVNGRVVKSCPGATCEYTGGP